MTIPQGERVRVFFLTCTGAGLTTSRLAAVLAAFTSPDCMPITSATGLTPGDDEHSVGVDVRIVRQEADLSSEALFQADASEVDPFAPCLTLN